MMALTLSVPAELWFTPCENAVMTAGVRGEHLVELLQQPSASSPQASRGLRDSAARARGLRARRRSRCVCASMNARSTWPFSASHASKPLNRCTSVPGASGRCRSAICVVAVRRGSSATIFMLGRASRAASMRCRMTGWHHAVLEPDEHDEIGVIEIVVAHRHHVLAERALVPRDGRRHAQPRVRVDVRAADVALHELVGDVIVLGEQLPGDVERDRLGAVFVDAVGGTRRATVAMAVIPAHAFAAHLRMQQPVFEPDGLAERAALHAQLAAIGRMRGIAAHVDRAALAGAWRARRNPRRSTGRWCGRVDVHRQAAAGESNSN